MESPEIGPGQVQLLAIGQFPESMRGGQLGASQQLIKPGRAGRIQAQRGADQHVVICRMQPQRNTVFVGQLGGIRHVIDMTVGTDDLGQLETGNIERRLDLIACSDTGIDDNRGLTSGAGAIASAQQIAVGLPGTDHEMLDEHKT